MCVYYIHVVCEFTSDVKPQNRRGIIDTSVATQRCLVCKTLAHTMFMYTYTYKYICMYVYLNQFSMPPLNLICTARESRSNFSLLVAPRRVLTRDPAHLSLRIHRSFVVSLSSEIRNWNFRFGAFPKCDWIMRQKLSKQCVCKSGLFSNLIQY